MRAGEIVLTLVILTVFCLAVTQASAVEPASPTVCVSAVGPVDASGDGMATPVRQGDCP